jgi:hypothetical protein
VVSDERKELPALSPTEIAAWAKLRDNLSPYIPKESASAPPLPGKPHLDLVVGDKARLFQSPSVESRTRMYLVKGDQVEIIDDSKLATGWCRIRYVGKSGKAIEAWMQTQDIDLPQK